MALAVMQFHLFVFSEENAIANVIFAFGVNFVVFQLQLKKKLICSQQKQLDTLQIDSFWSKQLNYWMKTNLLNLKILIENISENEVL